MVANVNTVDQRDAEETLRLIRENVYNVNRPSEDVFRELCAVIRLLDARLNNV